MRPETGLINQRIEIYADQDIPDGSGGMIPNSVLYWATSANVKPIHARRDLAQAQEQFKPAFTFEISDRNDKNVRPNMLLKYRGSWFTITNCVPDYVYVQKLVITAITSDPPLRVAGAGVTIDFGWSDINYHNDEEDAIFQQQSIESDGFTELTLPFPIEASGKFIFFRVPHGQIILNHFFINNTNYGEIPSFRWYEIITIGDFDYYLSNSRIYLNQNINNIIFTRNGI